MKKPKKISEDDYAAVRCCSRAEAIQLTDELGKTLELGNLNHKNWTLRCKGTNISAVTKALNKAAKTLDIKVPVTERVYIAELSKKDVLVKF